MGPLAPRDRKNFRSQLPSYLIAERTCWFARFPGVPKYIYRYTSRRNADDLLLNGRLRLGTLSEYRKVEELNSAQGDAEEGSRRWTTTLAGIPFQTEISSADTWIYCCSSEKSKRIMDSFQADAALQIDVDIFAEELGKIMALHAEIGSVRNVDYMDHHSFLDGRDQPPLAMFSKSFMFSEQKEVRFSFERRGDKEKSLRYNYIDRQLRGGFGSSPRPDERTEVVKWQKNPFVEDLKPILVQSKVLRSAVLDVTETIGKE